MTKVSIASLADASPTAPPPGFEGAAETRALFDADGDPIHTHAHLLAQGAALRIGPMQSDCVLYVRTGGVDAGGRRLEQGSSLVVEHGAMIDMVGVEACSELITFHAQRAAGRHAGGHVHLLPRARVKSGEIFGTPGVVGAMHANAACPTCEVWLHENFLPAREQTPEDAAKGIHAHSEDEVIFVLEGQMHFGTKVLEPGSAIAIAANAFYGFGTGPAGLRFINFRAGRPSEIRFKAAARWTKWVSGATWERRIILSRWRASLSSRCAPGRGRAAIPR